MQDERRAIPRALAQRMNQSRAGMGQAFVITVQARLDVWEHRQNAHDFCTFGAVFFAAIGGEVRRKDMEMVGHINPVDKQHYLMQINNEGAKMNKKVTAKSWSEAASKAVKSVGLDDVAYFREAEKRFSDFYEDKKTELLAAEKSIRQLLDVILSEPSFVSPKVTSRLKERDECIKKFQKKYRTDCEEKSPKKYSIEPHITDIIGLRVVCYYESDIDLIRDILVDEFDVISETNKLDELRDDNDFGYRAKHFDLKLKKPRLGMREYARFSKWQFEVQVRTLAQDAWSELDHKLKYKKDLPEGLQRKITMLAALFEMADQQFEDIRDASEALKLAAETNAEVDEENVPLDTFGFIRVVKGKFGGHEFQGDALSQLLGEVNHLYPKFSIADFRKAIIDNYELIQEYRGYLTINGYNFSPLNAVRHCLYNQHPVKFRSILESWQSKNFKAWKNENSSST